MIFFFGGILLFNSVFTISLFANRLRKGKKLDIDGIVLLIFQISSAIWSFGFGALIFERTYTYAYFARSFGIFGTFIYMITAQLLLCRIAETKEKASRILYAFSCLGLIVFILTIIPGQTLFRFTPYGMSYSFKPGVILVIYTVFFVVMSLNMMAVIISMGINTKVKRIRVFGKYFLAVEVLVLLGTVLDMIFPVFGMAAIPGSSITQFLGMLIISYAIEQFNKNKINVENMSEFIYYSVVRPVLLLDAQHNVCTANESAISFLGLPENEKEYRKIRLEDFFDITEDYMFDFRGKSQIIDVTLIKGEIPCNFTISRIFDKYGDNIGYIVIIADVSERINYINKLQKARQEADASNTAKSQFLANMSHDIRTPMNAIIGFSELALLENQTPEITGYLEDIKSSSENLLCLINDLLDISKIEAGKMTLVDVDYSTSKLFHEIIQIIKNQAEDKKLEFKTEIDESLPDVLRGDEKKVKSILINILNNSVKYTEKGYVSFKIQVEKRNEDRVVIRMEFEDSGIGIKDELKDSIFDSFTRVDQSRNYGTEGSGLGLALVKGFCQIMGGSIEMESEYGKGSKFTVIIEQDIVDNKPIDLENIEVSQEGDFTIGSMQVNLVPVLVVDDNLINRRVISVSFDHYGFEVDVAESGPEAIKMCKEKRYRFVFMDQMMPDMDGIEAMQRIRRVEGYLNARQCVMVALTANAVIGAREELINNGFDEYLSKPVNYREFEKIIQRYIPANEITIGQKQDNIPIDTFSIEGVDIATGINHCGGDLLSYIEVLDIMARTSSEQLKEIRKSWKAKDYKNYTIYVHALKGSCNNIGAKEYGEKARLLEMAGKSEDSTYIDGNTDDFIREYKELIDRIKEAISIYGEEEKEDDKLEDLLRSFLNAIREYDFANAGRILKGMRSDTAFEEAWGQLEVLESALEAVDIDKMEQILSDWIG